MFIFHDIKQNTDEWFGMRGGKLTSSKLGVIMANYGKAFGEPAKKYAVNIAIEQITGKPISSNFTNDHMLRGQEQEPIAIDLYEKETFSVITNGGFYCTDFIGCSPDGHEGEYGVIEVKSVISSVHYANVKRQCVDPAYKWQCIGNLKFSDRKWLDFISYCADYPEGKQLFIHRIRREDLAEEFKMIDLRVSEFKKLVNESKTNIISSSYDNY